MSKNTYDYFAMANAAACDIPITQLADGLQKIEDPRVRLFTVGLFFFIACQKQGLNPARLVAMLGISVENAYKQDTAEMRGMIDFIINEVL